MPGGTAEAWQHLEPIWTAIAAKVDPHTGKPLEGSTRQAGRRWLQLHGVYRAEWGRALRQNGTQRY